MINIIGAGPAGLYTAYLLSKAGKEVNVFEEHKEIGKPIQCTGITTSHIKNLIPLKKEFMINKVGVARVISKNSLIDFNLKQKNIIIDRNRFDKYLAKLAREQGANIFTQHKFIRKRKNTILVKDTKKNKIIKIKNTILIGADGPLSSVSRILNKKPKILIGIQARVINKPEKNVFETYLGSISPGFFAWSVPEDNKISRVGLATRKETNAFFKQLLKRKNITKEDIIEYQAGLIPIYNPKIKIQNNKKSLFLVGDAATQVKATTGGGIIPAIISAKVLSDCIIKKKDYQKEFKKEIGKDLWVSLKIRKVLDRMNDNDLDYLIKLCKKKDVKALIEEFDREFPSKYIIKILLIEPKFLYFIKYLF